MNDKAKTMKKEINTIAGYKALMISKFYISAILGITAVYLGFIRYAMSPMYILLILFLLPPIAEHILKDFASSSNKLLRTLASEEPFLLNNLKLKYKYRKCRYVANSVSYLIAACLMLLWQYNYRGMSITRDFLLYVPTLILTTGILLRFATIIIYRIKLPYDLENNIV